MSRATITSVALVAAVFASSGAAAFTFHCTGNACRAVDFVDEGVGCTAVTNNSRYPVHVTMGINQIVEDLAPGQTYAPLNGPQCYGYYSGGETANYLVAPGR